MFSLYSHGSLGVVFTPLTVDREEQCGSEIVCEARESTIDDPKHLFWTRCFFDQAALPPLEAVGPEWRAWLKDTTDVEIHSWSERRAHAHEFLSPRRYLSVPVKKQLAEIPNWSRIGVTRTVRRASLMFGWPHFCSPALIVVSVSGRTWLWTFPLIFQLCGPCVSNTTAVALDALHFVLSVDSLLWCADFAVGKHWHSSDAVDQQVQGMIQICYTVCTCDQLNLGGVAAVEELARQIRIYVVVCGDPGNMSWSDSRFHTESNRAGDAWCRLYTEPAERRFRGRVWWNASGVGGDGAGAGGKVQARGRGRGKRKKAGGGRRPAAGKMTSPLAATLGSSGGVAAGLKVSGGLGAALPCASGKRSRLLPEVFNDCSCGSQALSSRGKATIREMNESAFALNFLETGGVGRSESSEMVGYSVAATFWVNASRVLPPSFKEKKGKKKEKMKKKEEAKGKKKKKEKKKEEEQKQRKQNKHIKTYSLKVK